MNTILFIADLHCGSRWGLTPKKYHSAVTDDMTRWLWGAYQWLLKQVPSSIDLLILNGDMIDGKQARSTGVGLHTSCLEEQTDMAIDALVPLVARTKKTIRIEGTAYHESYDGPLGKLDATFNIKKPDPLRRIVQDIDLGDGAILNVKHQPEGEGALYRGTTMDRELLWACVSETMKSLPRATHVVRSHLHSDAHMRGFGKEINFTSGLCLQQPYALHRRRYRWIPDIGITLMRREKFGHKGWLTMNITKPLPALEASKYESL